MGFGTIITGLSFIVWSKFLREESTNENKHKCITNYIESDIFMKVIKIFGYTFIFTGMIDISTQNTIFEMYSFIMSLLVISIFIICIFYGFYKYLNKL